MAYLTGNCTHKLGPAACDACALSGAVAAAIEDNAEVVRYFLSPWLGEVFSWAQIASLGAAADTPACPTRQASKAKKLPPMKPQHRQGKLIKLMASTSDLTKSRCFESLWGHQISRGSMKNSLRGLQDSKMPAVLKAAALGGCTEIWMTLFSRGLVDIRSSTGLEPPSTAEHALSNAAAYGHTAFLTALFEANTALCGSTLALQLALEGGHLDAAHCLLGYHGAGHRRVVMRGGASQVEQVIEGALANGHVGAILQLQHMTLEADGFAGSFIGELVFGTDKGNLDSRMWRLLASTCRGGKASDLKLLLNHPTMKLAFRHVAAQMAAGHVQETATTHGYCTAALIERLPNAAECVAKLRLLLALPPPHHLQVPWEELAEAMVDDDWHEGLWVLLLEMPAHHTPVLADFNSSYLLRRACALHKVSTAEMLLSITGPHAVDPRARHQSATRTACGRNMPDILALLLRQTGERGVRMQPGKRSFFYGALRPHVERVPASRRRPAVDKATVKPSDPCMDDCPGGYTSLKLLLGATGAAAVPPHMWAHGADGLPSWRPRWAISARGPVERQYRDVGWGGGIQRMSRRDMVLKRATWRLLRGLGSL